VASSKNIQSADKVDPNAWMITFGDLIMLLLTFFVLLLTMKSMDEGTVRKISIQASGPLDNIGIKERVLAVEELERYVKPVVIRSNDMLEKAFELLEGVQPLSKKISETGNLRDIVEVTEGDRGVEVTLSSDQLFDSGEAEIRPDRYYILDQIGVLFRYAKNDILIMGHTDDIPTSGLPFKSNWDLSFYRALSVLYYLTDSLYLKPDRFAAGGFGDTLPRFPNDTKENREKNRRVVFVLKHSV
jgi:chemotaxis protein MotB